MANKKILCISATMILALVIYYCVYMLRNPAELGYNSSIKDFVPDEQTAIKIANVIADNVYSGGLKDYKPFYATLINDSTWLVSGHPKKTWFAIQLGGCPEIEIRKKDGKILKAIISR